MVGQRDSGTEGRPSTHPHVKVEVLVSDALDVEADGWHCCHDFSDLYSAGGGARVSVIDYRMCLPGGTVIVFGSRPGWHGGSRRWGGRQTFRR